MRREYSPIDDLYGVNPEGRQPKRRRSGWLYFAIILAGLFFYESVRPVRHLRDAPPSGFVEVGGNPSAGEIREHERIAHAYWELAIDSVQENYPYGATLPSTPPRYFRLQAGNDATTRVRFWNKLREVWYHPEIWVKGYEWDTSWVNDLLSSLRTVVKNYLHV